MYRPALLVVPLSRIKPFILSRAPCAGTVSSPHSLCGRPPGPKHLFPDWCPVDRLPVCSHGRIASAPDASTVSGHVPLYRSSLLRYPLDRGNCPRKAVPGRAQARLQAGAPMEPIPSTAERTRVGRAPPTSASRRLRTPVPWSSSSPLPTAVRLDSERSVHSFNTLVWRFLSETQENWRLCGPVAIIMLVLVVHKTWFGGSRDSTELEIREVRWRIPRGIAGPTRAWAGVFGGAGESSR